MQQGAETDEERRKLARLEEVLWVTQAQTGDSSAFVHLMERYEKQILYYLRRLVPEADHALDLHQEVWIEAFRGLPSLKIPGAFHVWVYRIARNKAARFIRNEVLHDAITRSLAEEHAAVSAPDNDGAVEPEALHHALGLIPPHDREILALHYLKDLSTQEIAAILDCPPGTVKSRLYHARLALRRFIEREKL